MAFFASIYADTTFSRPLAVSSASFCILGSAFTSRRTSVAVLIISAGVGVAAPPCETEITSLSNTLPWAEHSSNIELDTKALAIELIDLVGDLTAVGEWRVTAIDPSSAARSATDQTLPALKAEKDAFA